MDKRDKRHQREKQREIENKQSKEFKLFDKETKDYSYSLIFTNDLKEVFDAKNDCKALFEKDQDNDYFYVFDKTGKYVKCISQENGFCGTWNEFKSYSMIQWSNSECVVIYLKDYSEATIENALEAYLLEDDSLCLENDLMESNMENKCLNTETNDIITITFTSDIEVMIDLVKKCKNDIENDIDNFSEFRCYDYNQVFALDRVLDKHNKFKGSFRYYKEIEYITDSERVVYLENFTQESIDSWINIFLSEYEVFKLIESGMENKVIKEIETIKGIKEIDSKQKRFFKLLDLINSKEFKSKKYSEYYLKYNSSFDFEYETYDTWLYKWVIDNSIRRDGAVQLGYKKGIIGFYESNNNESCLIENDRILKFHSKDNIDHILDGLMDLLNAVGFFS